MTTIFAISISLFVLLALAIVLFPLGRKQGISVSLLLFLGISIPLSAVSLYAVLGNPKVLSVHVPPASQTPEMSGLIAGLEQRLASDSEDLEGWLLLSNSYLANQQLPQAQLAFEQAHRLSPEDTGVMLSLIDVMVTQQNGLFLSDADALIAQVRALEPDNALALWFAGLSAQQKGDSLQAAEIFKKMKQVLPKDAPSTQRILEKLEQLTH